MKTFSIVSVALVIAAGCGGDDSGPTGNSGGAAAGHAGAGRSGAGHGGTGARAGNGGASGTTSGEGGVPNEGGSGAVSSSGEAGAVTGPGAAGAEPGAGMAGMAGGGGEGGAAAPEAWEIDGPSFNVESQGEDTRCAVVDLGNAHAIHAGALRVTTSDNVYELTVGATSVGSPGAPSACNPFGEFEDADVKPLLFTRQRSEDIVLPAGDGYTLGAHQLLRFEVHAFNTSADASNTVVHLRVEAMPDSSYEREAGLLLLENGDFSVPASAMTTADAYFPTATTVGSASIFRAVGNVHAFGTRVTMSTGASKTGPFTPFYDVAVTDVPAPAPLDPTVTPPNVGGIQLECLFNNPTGTPRSNGVSSMDEHCMGFLYHAPAVDSHFCVLFGGNVACGT